MEGDHHPDFADAWTSNPHQLSEDASWNPALRPNAVAPAVHIDARVAHRQGPDDGDEDDDDFFARYPNATPKKNDQVLQHAMDAREDAPVFRSDETAEEQSHTLEEQLPSLGMTTEELDHSKQHYEHQAQITDLAQAQIDSADVPLMEHQEKEQEIARDIVGPTDASIINIAETGALQQELDQIQHSHPPLDRSFTSNFAGKAPEEPKRETPAQEPVTNHDVVPVDPQWPAVGDDKIFGELLGDKGSAPVTSHLSATSPEHRISDEFAPNGNVASIDTLFSHAQPSLQAQLPTRDTGEVALIAKDESRPVASKERDIAAAWQAALDDDDLLEVDNSLDPSRYFGEDDDDFLNEDGFLEDEAVSPPPPSQQSGNVLTQRYSSKPVLSESTYLATGSQLQSQAHVRSAETPNTGLFDVYNQTFSTPQHQPSSRPQMNHAQSFADKAKGGYQSPYDLPMDVVKPRRRPQPQHSLPTLPAEPPRSTPYHSQVVQETPRSPPGNPSSAMNPLPPSSRQSNSTVAPQSRPVTKGLNSNKSIVKVDGDFFADLPMAAKSRGRLSGAYTPQPDGTSTIDPYVASSQAHQSQRAPLGRSPALQLPAASLQQRSSATDLNLRQPEKLPLLPDQPTNPPSGVFPALSARTSDYSNAQPKPVPAHSRFSPAPHTAAQTSTTSRYSPAPATQLSQARTRNLPGPTSAPQPMQSTYTFAPRTSSPLAYPTDKQHARTTFEQARNATTSPPKINALQNETSMLIERRRSDDRSYTPVEQNVELAGLSPPVHLPTQLQRPRTQSPSTATNQLSMAMMPKERPSSSSDGLAPTQRGPVLPHRRQFSKEVTFTPPQDERSRDVLERWKGYPIFKWSAGGPIVLSFPKLTPSYNGIKCTAGAITLQNGMDIMPMDQQNSKFPGPLPARSKGKKKDVVAWLTGKVDDLERRTENALLDFSAPPNIKKRADEKIVLWKIVKIFVENDGVLESKSKIEEDVRKILLPNIAQMAQVADLQSSSAITAHHANAVDKQVLFQLHQALLEGQRERAVWIAEEKKLWGHAMLIASTMGPETWKQIVSSFVRSQVKSAGSDVRSLSALYQVFGGSSEDCVDELVPPSARAGFQMVNKSSGTTSGDPLEGLDQWRETLGLIISNRTANDGQSLIALGKLLASYARIEAAHTCFLFARSLAKSGGVDDADAHFVLLGANQQSHDECFGNDLDGILLTEIYEWASSLSAPSTTATYMPHLQAFKFIHAQELAAQGFKSKAQTYCDHITSAYQSTTRPSQYYHPTFTQSVADLSAFLSQTPTDGKQGFFSKPAMNKVSSGAASWFTKFVSGDDDQELRTSGGQRLTNGDIFDAGPFGGVAGDTPPASQTPSGTNLYNPMMSGLGIPGSADAAISGLSTRSPATPSSVPSKYAPSTYLPPAFAQADKSLSSQPFATDKFALHTPPIQSSPAKSFAPVQSGDYFAGSTASLNNLGVSSFEAPAAHSSSFTSSAHPSNISSRYTPNLATQQSLGASIIGASKDASNHATSSPAESMKESPADFENQSKPEPGMRYIGNADQQSYQTSVPDLHQEATEQILENPFTRPAGVSSHIHAEEDATPANERESQSSFGGYNPSIMMGSVTPSGGYEPPTIGYQPYEPEPESQDEEPRSRPRKSFMDDDDGDADDLAQRAEALKKSQADREADDTFRKAADADAARDKDGNGDKKGWFGGWFGGKRDLSSTPGPIRAKLGEESSFYYDEKLKKWVNKKGGPEIAAPAAATPPPPKGPPSRTASGAGGPPSGPPSRVNSTAGIAAMVSKPPTSGSVPGFAASGPPSRPSSRAATPASLPSTSDGIGAALPGSSSEAASGSPSRPSTGTNTINSLDDLLGGLPGGGSRKAGTLKGKKKGGRYVDVMAK